MAIPYECDMKKRSKIYEMWNRMRNLYRNIHFLSKYKLDDFKYDIMADVYDNIKYEQCDGGYTFIIISKQSIYY